MFLFVLSYISGYFALIEKYKASLIAMFPAFVLYFLVAGLQYDVGTDYFSYINIFEDASRHQFYINRGEYLFAYLNIFLNWLKLPAQSIFLSISFIQSVFVFVYFKKIKKKGFFLTLFFVAFICVTNIYNNQLNGLRQYVVIAALPLLTILVYEKKFTLLFILFGMVSLFHNTAWFLLFLLPIYFLYKKFNRSLFYLFLLTVVFYLLLGKVLNEIVASFMPSYAHYLRGDYAEKHTIGLFITKIYYLPLVFYFYLIYDKSSSELGDYFHFMVFAFTLTFWFFLLALSLGIATRFYYYVVFFMLFPMYYLLHYNYVKGRLVSFVVVLSYIALPYIAKVTFLAKNEFLYNSIIWS